MRLGFQSYRILLSLMCGSIWILLMGSCGGEDVVQGMPGGGGGGGGAAPAAPATPTPEASAGPAATTRGVSPIQFDTTTRDPFTRPYPQDYLERPGSDALADDTQTVDDGDLGPLAPYPIETLQLVGILSRSARPMAVFRVPDSSNLAEFAFIGDRVGPNGVGFIEDIQPNRVIVAYEGDPNAPPRRLPVFLRSEEGPFDVDFELIER